MCELVCVSTSKVPFATNRFCRLGVCFKIDPTSNPAGTRSVRSSTSFADRSEPFARAIVRRSSTLETSSVVDEKLTGSSVIEIGIWSAFRSLVPYKQYYCSSSLTVLRAWESAYAAQLDFVPKSNRSKISDVGKCY